MGIVSPILRLCSVCGRTAPEAEIRANPAGKCWDCGKTYERDKSRRRRATSAPVRNRDSAAWQHARQRARARDGGCIYRHQGGCHGQIHVHHIKPPEQGGTNALSNLITVCRAQHELAERRPV